MRYLTHLIGACLLCTIIFAGTMCTPEKKTDNKKDETTEAESTVKQDPFLNHRDSVPSKKVYDGPLFVLSHDYPTSYQPVVDPSWRQALKGEPISASNVFAYMDSLKSYIAPNLMPFFTKPKNWLASEHGWFHQPWLGAQREAIMGTYLGNGNPANMFKSLKVDESGYVVVLYDSTAAYTVGQIWGKTGEKVNLVNDAAQFKEGSVIVKLAFSNINAPEWPVMEGAQVHQVYDTIATKENPKTGYQLRNVSFFQMDVIVKDSMTAPKTGWVYSTFVYDKEKEGTAYWDKMVPLGAMWGNDPDVNSPIKPPYPKLSETVINPDAPEYSTETLGWGGRLSGPNDGAVTQKAYDINTKQAYTNLPLSSCMSCHSPAQDKFSSFLLPGPFPSSDTLFVYTPGSTEWMRWFRDDYGNVPFDEGQIATDYDMVTAFKAIPAYNAAQPEGLSDELKQNLIAIKNHRQIHSKTKSLFWH